MQYLSFKYSIKAKGTDGIWLWETCTKVFTVYVVLILLSKQNMWEILFWDSIDILGYASGTYVRFPFNKILPFTVS